jgi:hypothetical protein
MAAELELAGFVEVGSEEVGRGEEGRARGQRATQSAGDMLVLEPHAESLSRRDPWRSRVMSCGRF